MNFHKEIQREVYLHIVITFLDANGPGNFKPLVQPFLFHGFDHQWSMVWGSSSKIELSLFKYWAINDSKHCSKQIFFFPFLSHVKLWRKLFGSN